MKICPKCGNMLEDEMHFCINCGINLDDKIQTESEKNPLSEKQNEEQDTKEEAPPKEQIAEELSENVFEPDKEPEPVKKRIELPVKLVIAAIIVLAAGIIGIIAFARIIGFKTQRFISYQQAIISDRFLNGLEKLGNTVSTDSFSSDITITAQSDNEQLNEYLNGSSVILKMQTDNSEKNILTNAQMNLFGSPVLDGTVTYDDGKLGFYLPEADDQYYMTDADKMISAMENKTSDYFAKYESTKTMTASQERKMAEEYLDIIYTLAEDDNIAVAKKQDVLLTYLGEKFTGTVYTCKPTGKEVEKVLNKVADHIDEDENFKNTLAMLLDTQSLNELMGTNLEAGADQEDIAKALSEGTDSLRKKAKEIGNNWSKYDFEWKVAVDAGQARMISISFCSSENISTVIEYDASQKGAEQTADYIGISSEGSSAYIGNEYQQDKAGEYKGKLIVKTAGLSDASDSAAGCTVEYQADLSKLSALKVPYGTYDVDLGEYGTLNCEVKSGEKQSDDHSIVYTGSGLGKLTFNINTTEKGTAVEPDIAPTDISQYTSEEYENLFHSIGESVGEDFSQAFYGALGY